MIAAVVAVIGAPEIFHQAIGTANPSALPLDNGRNLLWFHAELVTLVALVLSFATWKRVRTLRKVHRT